MIQAREIGDNILWQKENQISQMSHKISMCKDAPF
jgi:hypothetical protein